MLTVPLTAETRGLIGRAELARMKPTATLVNVARGAVVDTDALTEALAARRIHAAALDVTDPEPLPRDHPLLKLDNVIITPAPGQRHRADPPQDGRDFGREPVRRAGRWRIALSGESFRPVDGYDESS